jgi:hypothetical protein
MDAFGGSFTLGTQFAFGNGCDRSSYFGKQIAGNEFGRKELLRVESENLLMAYG